MPAERVPLQTGMLGAERRQSRSSEPAPLVPRIGVWLFYPAQAAPPADLVIHGEHLMPAKVCCALAPPSPLRRYGVLPRRTQDGQNRPAVPAAKPSSRQPLHRCPDRLTA